MRACSRLRRASRAFLPFATALLCCTALRAAPQDAPPSEQPAWEDAAQAALLAGEPRLESEAALRGIEELARDPQSGGTLRRASFELALQRLARTSAALGERAQMLQRLETL